MRSRARSAPSRRRRHRLLRPPQQGAGGMTPVVQGSTPTSLRGRFGLEMADRLLKSADADERLRGIQRAAAIGTPEAVGLLVGVADPNALGRTDSRALLELARALAPFTSDDRARARLVAILGAPAPSPAGRRGELIAFDADAGARVALARATAARALATSTEPKALEALANAVRTGGPGQTAAAVRCGVESISVLDVLPRTTPHGQRARAPRPRPERRSPQPRRAADAARRHRRAHARRSAHRARAARRHARAREGRRGVRREGLEAARRRGRGVRAPRRAGALQRRRAPRGRRRDGPHGHPPRRARAGRERREGARRAARRLERSVRAPVHPDRARPRPDRRRAQGARDLHGRSAPRRRRRAGHRALAERRRHGGPREARAEPLARRASPCAATCCARCLLGARSGPLDERARRARSLGQPRPIAPSACSRAWPSARPCSTTRSPTRIPWCGARPRSRRSPCAATRPPRRCFEHLQGEKDEATRHVLALGLRGGDPNGTVPTLDLVDRAESGGADAPLSAARAGRSARTTRRRRRSTRSSPRAIRSCACTRRSAWRRTRIRRAWAGWPKPSATRPTCTCAAPSCARSPRGRKTPRSGPRRCASPRRSIPTASSAPTPTAPRKGCPSTRSPPPSTSRGFA